MLQKFIDAANANPGVCGLIMCAIGAGFLAVYAFDRKSRQRMKRRIKQLRAALNSKEQRIAELEAEVWRLKVDRFAADQDGKREIKKRDVRIQQLETDKKQMLKWGVEK